MSKTSFDSALGQSSLLCLVALACAVDDRNVVCDLACQAAELAGGSSGGGVSSGGASATGGASLGGKSAGGAPGKGGTATTLAGAGGALLAAGGTAAKGGATATGGTAMNGGAASGGTTMSASGGAPVHLTDCIGSVGKGNAGLLDDFSDRDLGTQVIDGRQGYWVHVRADNLNPPPSVLLESGNAYMAVSGAAILTGEYPWANVKADLRGIGDTQKPLSCVYDASKYRGVRFRARGNPFRFSLEMDANVPVTNAWGAPGTCTASMDGDCYARYGVKVTTTATFSTYQYLWSDLAPGYVSTWMPVFNPAHLLAIYFEALPDTTGATLPAYAFDIDDVEFF